MKRTPFEDLPPEEREDILQRRLERAQRALGEAERALEGRMRELDAANRDLRARESELVERLEMESRQLLAAQRIGGFATIFGRAGEAYQSSAQLNELLGYPKDRELSPADVVARLHPLDRLRILSAAQTFFAEESAQFEREYEHRILHPDLGIRWLRWSLRKEAGTAGKADTVLGSVHDITEARANARAVKALQLRAMRRVRQLDRLTDQLERQRQRAETALEGRTRFLSHFAHQFRTPLSSLSGVIELLDAGSSGDVQREALMFAEHATERLTSLVDEALAEAEGDETSVSLFPAPVDLGLFFEEEEAFWRKIGSDPGKGNAARFDVEPNLPAFVEADAVRLRECVDCMVAWAIQNGEGARFEVQWRDSGMLELACRSQSPSGLSAELADDPQIARAAILAEAMGGTLEREGEPTSAVVAALPLPVVANTGGGASALKTSDGARPQVLLAEDTVSNQQIIAALLEKMGCSVETASNGAEAVEAADRCRFDAILMDVQMPVMTGEQAVRTIRAGSGPSAQTPVIGITAHSLQEERDRLLAAGMSACLSKPVKEAEIRSALQTAIGAPHGSCAARHPIDVPRFRAAFEALPGHFAERFLAAIESDLDLYGRQLADAVAAMDSAQADRQAHALKGVAANIGGVGLVEALEDFRQKPIEQSQAEYRKVCEQLAATRAGCGELFASVIAGQ